MAKPTTNYTTREDATLYKYLHEIGNEIRVTKDQEAELTREIRKGSKKALDTLVKANLLFVVNVAKGYQNQGMSLSDLINEGNIGLIKAAKRFDETKGFKFISYAVWWIRQAILSALAEQSRIIRLPLNKVSSLYSIGKTSKNLEQEFGREPTSDEIADELGVSMHEVANTINISSRHLSLDTSFSDDEGTNLFDVIYDKDQPSPEFEVMEKSLKFEVEQALSSLTEREVEVISLYYGINNDTPITLDEIGKKLNITRERVRQIKEKALRRLRYQGISTKLKPYYDDLASEY